MPTDRVSLRRRLPRVVAALPLLGLCALAPSALFAADEPLTLKGAIERAVGGNADLRRERIAIDSADGRLESALGFFDINLSTDLTYLRSTRPAAGLSDLQAGTTDRFSLNLGLERNLESGGNISLGLSGTRNKTTSGSICGTLGMSAEECDVYNTTVGLNLTQPLLRGFGPSFALANVRKQTVQKDQALLSRQMRASLVLRDVVNAYWGLSYATQDLAIRRSAVDLAREQLRVTQAQIDVGRSAPVDAAAVERAIGERMQEVLLSEQDLLFRTLDLRRLFGLAVKPGEPLLAAADVPQAGGANDIDGAAEIERALAANPQLRLLKLGMKLSDIDLAVARSTVLPQLDLVGQVGATGVKRDLEDSLQQTLGFEARNFSVGLRFQFPIQNRVAGGQLRVARAAGEDAQLEAGDYELELRYQVQRLASNIRSSSKRLELAKATVGFATQNLEAEKARFSVGRSTNNEVLRVQQELKNAEIQVVRATVDLLVAQTSLQAITGDLLEHHRLVLKGI
jgi:outer membrane protein